MATMPVGPRAVEMEVWPCAGCGTPIYRSPTAGPSGHRHVGPVLGAVFCDGFYGDRDFLARPA